MIFTSLIIFFTTLWSVDGCLSGWLRHENKCYNFSHDTESWIGAINMCKLFGGKLVEIKTTTENDYLAATAKLSGLPYWIGLTDAQEESTWIWASNMEKLVDTGYSNWYPNEPNNSGSDENCVVIGTDGHWNDGQCHSFFHYICEADNSEETIVG